MEEATQRLFYAFLISALAGMSTMLGALAILFPCFKTTRYTVFAYSNAFAGGVILFVALCEILQVKAIDSFRQVLQALKPGNEKYAYACGYLLYFAGCVLCYLVSVVMNIGVFKTNILEFSSARSEGRDVIDLEHPQQQGARSEQQNRSPQENAPILRKRPAEDKLDKKTTCSMAINMFIALTVHNIPEGMITFAEIYNEGAQGLPFAIAIAVHNIPEGMAIAIPVFYATGTVFYPLLYVALASIAEPLGGLIGFLLIKHTHNQWFNAVAFSVISGMMSWIVLYEMIPLSLKHSKSRFFVSLFFVFGSFVMASSLAGLQMA